VLVTTGESAVRTETYRQSVLRPRSAKSSASSSTATPRSARSTTTVSAATAAAYAGQVEQLRAAIAHVRESEHQARRARPGGQPAGGDAGDHDGAAGAGARSAPTCLCGCQPPRRLRMAPTVYALADVLYGACGQPFATG